MRLVSMMYRFTLNALVFVRDVTCSVFSWFWRRFVPVLRWIESNPRLSALRIWISSNFLAKLPLPWFKKGGSAAERNDEKQEPGGSARDVEGQGKARGQKRDGREWENLREEDEFHCDYDSTWEDEESQNIQTIRRSSYSTRNRSYKFRRFESAARDMQNFRHDYPNLIRSKWDSNMINLRFYTGEARCLPDGLFIHEIHDTWYKDYSTLESVHTYVQWLFPLQEPGMNSQASTLTKQEIKEFCRSQIAQQNLLKSYKLMLDFYGMELSDEREGEVRRAPNWQERFSNLNSRTHNNLRITRILKCLGTLGFRRYQAPLVHFFLQETLVNGQLPNVKESALGYFLFAVLDKRERRELLKFAYMNYEPKDEFVWCPKRVQVKWAVSVEPSER